LHTNHHANAQQPTQQHIARRVATLTTRHANAQ
jgi:hypothetical protein